MKTVMGWVAALALAGALGATAARAQETSAGRERFYYLRCSATGYGTSSGNRLQPTENPRILELSYEVREGWMVSTGDDCLVTETSEQDGWGTLHRDQLAVEPILVVPWYSELRSADPSSHESFLIRYPRVGRYRATLDLADNRLAIAFEGSVQEAAGAESFLYLRCNATAWDVQEATRLRPTPDPEIFEISFDVSTPWIVSAGDECVVTETNSYDGWGDHHVDYTTNHPITVGVDARTRLARAPAVAPERASFRVRYPRAGRYHARIDVRDGTLQLTGEGPLTSGGEVWSSPGSLVVDGSGRLYLSEYAPAPALSRINRETGRPLWSRIGSGYSVDSACAFPQRLLLREAHAIVAFDPDSGALLWTTDLEGALAGDAYASLFCQGTGDLIEVTVGNAGTPSLLAIQKSSGEIVWSTPTAPYAAVIAATPEVVVTQEMVTRGNQIRAFALATGVEAWRIATGDWISLIASPSGDLYITLDHEIRQLDPRTGAVRWTFATNNPFPWLTFESGLTFLRDLDRIVKLDPVTGAAVFSYDMTSADGSYPSSTVLASGRIVVTRHPADRTELVLLDASGNVAWTRAFASASAWPEEDGEQRLYLRANRTIAQLDARNGHERWSYTHDVADQPSYYGGGFGYVADSDADSLFVTYAAPGYHYPPMSLIALNAANGARRWQYDDSGAIRVVGRDATHLFLQTGYFTTVIRALLK